MSNTYTLFWLTGQLELVFGPTVAEAMTLAGYGRGALAALDFYAEGDKTDAYEWQESDRRWTSLPETCVEETT